MFYLSTVNSNEPNRSHCGALGQRKIQQYVAYVMAPCTRIQRAASKQDPVTCRLLFSLERAGFAIKGLETKGPTACTM